MKFLTLKWRTITSVFLVGGLLLVILASFFSFISTNFESKAEVTIGAQTYKLTVADTDQARVEGLSGVEELRKNEGLLMIFDVDGLYEIWMKDMKIPIDIIWLDASKQVIYIVHNASPSLGTSKIFTPKRPARYIIEVNAGAAKQQGLRIGSQIEFDQDSTGLW